MSNRKCVVTKANEDAADPAFEMTSPPIPSDVSGDDVLLKVLACGVCHSDVFCTTGTFGNAYPRAPGHEVIGKVVKTGSGSVAKTFAEGTIVGIGWHADHCLSCEACSDGDFVCCENHKVSGLHIDGGYQEYMVAPSRGLARVPEGMDPVTAAPMMCAGVTVFNGLRTNLAHAAPPALIAVVGIGGLGHVAIQFAAKMGYTVAAVSRGSAKREPSLGWGATHYIDSTTENVAEALTALGGAKVILCTGIGAKAMADAIGGLARNGKMVLLGIDKEPIPVAGLPLISKRRSIVGSIVGSGRDSQDTLQFAKQHGITPKLIVFEGIEKAQAAYATMIKGEYRVVIKIADE